MSSCFFCKQPAASFYVQPRSKREGYYHLCVVDPLIDPPPYFRHVFFRDRVDGSDVKTPIVLPSCIPTLSGGHPPWQVMRYFLEVNFGENCRLNGFQCDAFAFSALATNVFYDVFEPDVNLFYGIQHRSDRPVPNARE